MTIPKPAKRGPSPPKRIRRSAPVPKKSRAKLMPKCKHCAHPAGKHHCHYGPKCCYVGQESRRERGDGGPECQRCAWCPGYKPAIGIRQQRRTPKAAIRRSADDLWSEVVKAGRDYCEVQRFYGHTCVGGLQAMHGIPRTFSATRFLPINGFAGCAGVHKYMTDRPELWSAVLLDAWGEPAFRELWALARASAPVDMEATVLALRAGRKD